MRVFRNSSSASTREFQNELAQFLRRAEAAQRLQGRHCLHRRWALSQGIAQVFPVFDIPTWVIRLIVLLIVIGLPIALVLAWMFEITPQGIKRTEDVDLATAAQQPKKRAWIFVVIIGALLSIGLFFLG